MNVITEHSARFGLPAEVVHAVLSEIEDRYQDGLSDLDIAVQVAATIRGLRNIGTANSAKPSSVLVVG